MLKKVSLVLSVLAVFGLAMTSPAAAKPQKQVNKTVHVNKTMHVNKNVKVNKTVHVNKSVHVNKGSGKFTIGKTYNGHIWYGHNRHFWHGRWYDYGVGPCWINVDGEWFWNILACPI